MIYLNIRFRNASDECKDKRVRMEFFNWSVLIWKCNYWEKAGALFFLLFEEEKRQSTTNQKLQSRVRGRRVLKPGDEVERILASVSVSRFLIRLIALTASRSPFVFETAKRKSLSSPKTKVSALAFYSSYL